MGANAQTSVPLYAAGEILTAANMNISAGTGVPVFANSTARDAGFGGTGEKVLAEGQFCYLEDSNLTQYYNGTSWVTLSALNFVSTATFSGVSTVSMPASTFTTTFRNYLVILKITATASDQQFLMRVNNAGSPRTGSNYTGASIRTYSSTEITNSAGATSFNLCAASSTTADTVPSLSITVYDPTSATIKTTWSYQGLGSNNSNQASAVSGGGVYTAAAENNDGLTFIGGGSGNLTGSYIVYGIKEN